MKAHPKAMIKFLASLVAPVKKKKKRRRGRRNR